MNKIQKTSLFERMVTKQFEDEQVCQYYSDATYTVGLWKSEAALVRQYASPESKILDVGCGAGRVMVNLLLLGYRHVDGIDTSCNMLEFCKKNQLKSNVQGNVYHMNAANLSFPNRIYDLILFLNNGLMTIPDRKKQDSALSNIHRVLSDNGVFIFTSPIRCKDTKINNMGDNKLRNFFNDEDCIVREQSKSSLYTYLHVPSFDSLCSNLTSSGFDIIDSFARDSLYDENDMVKQFSSNCLFVVCKKQAICREIH